MISAAAAVPFHLFKKEKKKSESKKRDGGVTGESINIFPFYELPVEREHTS